MKDKILVLTGPTGVGKTKYSIQLAKDFNGEIISCDSYQIYKYMNIGTAKIKVEEMDGVMHHNLDFVLPDEDYNTSLFKARTEEKIKEILEKKKLPILVGGTGLYVHSIIHNLDFSGGKADLEKRKLIEKEVELNGLEYIYDKLFNIDKNIVNFVEKNNKHRVIRAYEIYLNTGESPVQYLKNFRNNDSKYDYLYIIINQERNKLYDRINSRVDEMLKEGLSEEIENLIKNGYDFDLKSFKAIGYKEFREFFQGTSSLKEVVNKIKQNSRNYAKRQLTWFRRVEEAKWINKDDFNSQDDFYKKLKFMVEEFLSQ